MWPRFRSVKSNYTNCSNEGDDDASFYFSGSYATEETGDRNRTSNKGLGGANSNVTQDSIPEEELAGEEIDLDAFTQVVLADKSAEEFENEAGDDGRKRMPLGLKLFVISLVVVCALLGVFLAVFLGKDSSSSDTEEKSAVGEAEGDSPTPVPSEDYILDILDEYTETEILLDETTIQGQAYLQLVMEEDDATENTSVARVTQRYALMSLYLSTEPEGWLFSQGWNTFSANECIWHGLGTCEDVGVEKVVTHLYLAGNGLGGTIPEEICLLTSLETLSLGENFLYGVLPQCIGGHSNLKSLRVQGNDITGDLPSGLLTLSTLEEVDISDNKFDGFLGVLFEGSNTSPAGLKIFKADDNWLTGPIPLGFGFLPALESLKLQDNQLLGTDVPESVCNLVTVFSENGQFIVDCVISCSCCVQVNC